MSANTTNNGLVVPKEPYTVREDAFLHLSGSAIMNASVMYYGGAKTGKTRLLISAFSGSNYIFLDFDRNYKATVNDIINSGAKYFNGKAAYNVLFQLMRGEISNAIVIIDALGSVIKPLCSKFVKIHTENDTKDDDAILLENSTKGIGVNHADSVTFFNLVIEPMTKNENSINFIHHTTQNMQGEKMEGNKGAWLSVFDFTYMMNRASRTFGLEAGRLPIAMDTIGEDNIYARINKAIQNSAEVIDVDNKKISVTRYKFIHANQSTRKVMNKMVKEGIVKKKKYESYGKTEFLEADYLIDENGQNSVIYDENGKKDGLKILYTKDNLGSGSE